MAAPPPDLPQREGGSPLALILKDGRCPNCYVGTVTEKNFFRVIDSSGKYDHQGLKIRGNPNSNKLFFESYTEFEKFYKIGEKNGYDFLNPKENE